MKTLQKSGSLAALYMAVAHLVGIVIFLVILDYLSITDPLMYVFFSFALVVLSLALFDRMKSGAHALMQVATAVGIIWAGSLMASGMVANAGLAAVVALSAQDPEKATLLWQGVEAVANGLGNANGEILGGVWVFLVSLAALRGGELSKGLNVLGLLVGVVGIMSLIPGLTEMMIGVFGLGQIIWFVGLGISLWRSNPDRATENEQATRLQVSRT